MYCSAVFYKTTVNVKKYELHLQNEFMQVLKTFHFLQ